MKRICTFIFFIMIVWAPALAEDWYVRPEGGNYRAENGTSYEDAWDGLENVVWGVGGVNAGDTLYVCGTHIRDNGPWVGTLHIDPISGTAGNPTIIRGDYSGNAGITWGMYRVTYSWSIEGSNTYKATLVGGHNKGWCLQDISDSSCTILARKNSVQEVEANPGSYFLDEEGANNDLYVQCTDSGNPTNRIYFNRYGYQWRVSNCEYITFLNIKCHGIENWSNPFDTFNNITWDGVTMSHGEQALVSLYTGNNYCIVQNCTLYEAENGIYTVSGGSTAGPNNCTFKNNTIYDIGVREWTYDLDAHGIGVQHGHSHLIEGNLIYNCGSGITFYAYTNGILRDCIVRYNYIHDNHTLGGANNVGIEYRCNNDSLSDKSGHDCYFNIVANCEIGIANQFEDEVEVYNNVVYSCTHSFYSSRSYDGNGPVWKGRNNISLSPEARHHTHSNSGGAVWDFDYNLYYPDTGNLFYTTAVRETNFADWRGAGYDTNSPSPADPLFVNGSGSYALETDFKLTSDSPAIDAGTDVNLAQDYEGTLVPQGFAPDIGAFECVKSLYKRFEASPSSGDIPLVVNFTGDAMGDYPPFSYNWNFGDGGSSTERNPTHTYNEVGDYSVTLTVTDNNNNQESGSLTIKVYAPVIGLTITSVTGNPAPGDGGTTDPNPGAHLYSRGSSVHVKALPNLNYRLARWTGDVDNSNEFSNEFDIHLDFDKSITANFCTKCGDVNGDLNITPTDAQAAFDIFLIKITNPTPCQKENADVNCDGVNNNPLITPADAQAIFDKYLGRSEFPCNCSNGSRMDAISLKNRRSSGINLVLDDSQVFSRDEVAVNVIVENTTHIKAFGFDLIFPSEILEFISVEKSGITEKFEQVDANEIAAGFLRVGGFGTKSIGINSSHILVTLFFKLKGDGSFLSRLFIMNTYDDIKNAFVKDGR